MTDKQIERLSERFVNAGDRIKALQYSIEGYGIPGADELERELDKMACRLSDMGGEFAEKAKEGSK
jgi:hypothetical protein